MGTKKKAIQDAEPLACLKNMRYNVKREIDKKGRSRRVAALHDPMQETDPPTQQIVSAPSHIISVFRSYRKGNLWKLEIGIMSTGVCVFAVHGN